MDLVQPLFGPFVDLDLSYGLLNIQVQEPINVNNTAWYDIDSLGIDLTQVYLSQTTLSNDIPVGGGAYGQGVFLPDTAGTTLHYKRWGTQNMTVLLTEEQRIACILRSGTPGGDNTPLVLDVYALAVRDLAGNPNVGQTNLPIRESADVVPPQVLRAVLHLSNGTLVVTLGEISDALPANNVALQKLTLVNTLGSVDPVETSLNIALSGATVTEEHSLDITLTLTQEQRHRAIEISNTAGGDGRAMVLSAEVGAFVDIGVNPSVVNLNVTVTEHPDTVPPVVSLVTLNYGTGTLVVTFGTEIMDLTGAVDVQLRMTRVFLSDDPEDRAIALVGATPTEVDGVSLTLVLTETQRIAALVSSGTPGGDGVAVTLDSDVGFTRDIAQNDLPAHANVSVVETPDTLIPTISSGLLDLNDGVLRLYTSETIHANPATLVDLTQLILENTVGDQHLPLYDVHGVHGRGNATVSPAADAVNVTIQLTLAQRAEAIRNSGTVRRNCGVAELQSGGSQ